MSPANDNHRELYPFLYDDGAADSSATRATLLAEVRASTLRKAADVIDLRRRVAAEYRHVIVEAGVMLADCWAAAGKVLTIGNGGSATDAQDAVADCLCPPVSGWRSRPALALTADVGVLTAVGNDVGFDEVFARQVVAFGEPGDVLLAFTTSGSSVNIRVALREARGRALHTIALVGDEGGSIATDDEADICIVARTQHIPRIQEAHATVWHAMLTVAQSRLADAAAAPGGDAGAHVSMAPGHP